jgi:TonB family protein
VRFLLSPDGNLMEVQLIRSAGVPLLDREVVFSVKQASFPFPPRNAPVVDRTFLVTYIYN